VRGSALTITAPAPGQHAGGLSADSSGATTGEAARLTLAADQTCGLAAGVWCANGLPAEMAVDQGYDDDRSLVFDSAVLEEPLELLGRPIVRLAIECDRPQALLAVRLCSIAPDGSSTLVSWGALNLTHRTGHELPTPLVPGERYDVAVSLNLIGERIPAGCQLRLAVSSAYWPQLWPSPESVELVVFADGTSVLELPIRNGASDEAAPRPFLAAEESAALVGHIEETGDRMRERRVDRNTGEAAIEDRQSYEVRISATGTDYLHAGTDRWTAQTHEPLRARAECERTVRIDRDGWHVRIETRSSLACDATRFFLENEVVAFEEGHEIFRRAWRSEILRDGV
jgi:hypothetical protein